ncbi:MAG: hypothetical protein R3B40_02690 [Polyangiales bacterium]|nr:hypothetical protein [Myxococcales bacterium]MCB9657019.1 hypothetical protein [Sandaracinaceae bacterium]
MLPPDPPLPDDLAAAWEAVQHDWDTDSRHAAFIELCAAQGRLPDAGALYRRVREELPEHATVAEQQQQRIMARALVMLAQHAPERAGPGARRVVLAAAVVVAIVMMTSAVWAASRLLANSG